MFPSIKLIWEQSTLLRERARKQKLENFEVFRKDLLAGLANVNEKTGFDEQIGIIYELRNYPRYYPVIERILEFQVKHWEKEVKDIDKKHYQILIDEANATLTYMNTSRIGRIFCRLRLNKYA
ncbi:MAG: hypothetical protein R3B92_02915 [Patescibacteria group bacterium]